MKLVGKIPNAIVKLSTLERLDFGNNSIRGTIPNKIGRLKKLRKLDLDINQLTGSLPMSLFDLRNLTWLDLDTNELTGTITGRFRRLINVEVVSLYGNNFSGSLPVYESIAGMDKLKYIYFDDNDLGGTTDLCTKHPNIVKIHSDCKSKTKCICPGGVSTCTCCQCH
uniref:Uncharacterized protein n=2 Tax=Corethron hystrix TaxID=216773 RepID=A0A7S1BI73_9STRA|mmetsp:Transcript_28102/g.64312  ORF Transcript_28102/g.64312 Transcript_28102/m.64312 type:complete len:167 (+) Transcript_28102:165-665(+)